MMLLKRILILIIAVIISIITFSGVNKTNAESAGPIYLGLETFRSSGYGYRQGGKKVWKIAQYNSPSGGTGDISQMIYCIKAGPGFGSSDMSSGNNIKISTYNQKFNLKDLSSIGSPYRNVLPTGTNYNKLMWVLDHMYIIPENGDETAKNNFLRSVIPNERYSLLTNDDIDVVQQLAIWYFTNPTGEYHYENIELYINSMKNVDSDYKTFEDLLGDDGWDRQDAASALYEYYINNADGSYVSPNATTSPIELDDSRASMEVSGSNLIAGPFRINELLDVDYTLTATYTNQDNQPISPRLGIKNSSGNVVATSSSLEDLVGQDFYLMIGTNTNTTTINITINASYSNKEITYWSVANAPATEQPVVIITEKDYNFSVNGSVSVNNGNYNLKLVKVDANNKQTTLSGARFSVSVNNGVATQYTTGSDGSITTNNIPITSTGTDTITIQEIQAPAGYNSLIGTLTVEVDKTISGGNYTISDADFTSSTNENGSTISLSGNTIIVTVPNEKISGSYDFQLIKKDDDTDANLQGAVFSVKINNGTAQQYTTNNSGIISVNDIEITQTGTDTITIEEITPPTGYNAMSGTIIIEVTKTTSGSSYVASGVDFAQNSQGNGTHVSLSGGVITLTVPNKKQEGSYNLQLIKKDKDTQANLSGAEFRIRINSQSSRNYTTDNNGTITIDDIQITQTGTDTITIEEITPPTGYSSMIETIVLEVTKTLSGGSYVASGVRFASGTNAQNCHVELNDGVITLTVPNEKITGSYDLQLIKQDSESTAKLSGAKFTVRINNGGPVEYTTNSSGIISINNIEITETGTDTITIEETQAPTGYNKIIGTLTINVTKTISDGEYVASNAQLTGNTAGSTINLSNGLITVTVPNEKITGSYNLQLIKQDSENQNALQGAKFTVRINNGQTQEYTTNDSGIIEINDIAITESGIDTITIEEIQAPTGYNKLIDTLTINVTKSEENGQYVASNIEFGEGTEPNGTTVKLEDGLITVTVPNEKITGSYDLQLIKQDSENQNPLQGAKFEVTINNGETVEYTTNESGIIQINDIAITETGTDTIIIEETEAPTGYNKIIDILTIDVTKTISGGSYIASNAQFSDGTNANGSTVNLSNGLITVTVPNEKKTGSYSLQIVKQDSKTKDILQGAKFQVIINSGEVKEYISDNNGLITINDIEITEVGTDTIRIEEIEAPSGYNKLIGTLILNVTKTEEDGEYKASNIQFGNGSQTNGAEVKLENGLITLTVPNEKIAGSYKLQLIKKDSKDNTRLANAIFNVKVNDNSLGNYTTGVDGTIETDTINIEQTGTDVITIEETRAPEGYNKIIDLLNINVEKTEQDGQYVVSNVEFAEGTETQGSTVELQGSTILVTVPNEKITGSYKLQLIKKDSKDETRLANATFNVKVNNNSLGDYTTGVDGTIETDTINIEQTGTDVITIEETQAPEGYNKIIDILNINVEKVNQDGKYIANNVSFEEGTDTKGSTVELQGNTIIVTIPNEKITGSYKLQLIKKDSKDDTRLANAIFNVKVNNNTLGNYTTGEDGTIQTDTINIEQTGTDVITIEETQAPEGYNKIIDTLNINVEKTEQDGKYIASNVSFSEGTNANGSTVELQGDTIIVTIPNEKITGSYNLQLVKVDGLNQATLEGAKFTVKINDGEAVEYTTDQEGKITINSIDITQIGTDTITINETQAPTGYNKVIGELQVNVTKTISDGKYVASRAEFTTNTQPQGSTINLENGLITITVPNEKQTGAYGIQLIKQDGENQNPLQGAKFNVTINNGQSTEYTTDANGTFRIDNIAITEPGTDTITITETEAPIGYNKLIDTLTVEVNKEEQNGEYVANSATFTDETNANGSTVNLQDGLITIIVPNERQEGSYNLQLIKVDSKDASKTLEGAKFNVTVNNGQATEYTTDENGRITINNIEITETGTDVITIEETQAPTGYNKIIGTLKVNVEKTVQNGAYVASNAVFTQDTTPNGSTVNLNNNLITVTVPNSYFDLSLRKFITGVNDEQITNRVPQVDVTPLIDGSNTTAIYNHTKQPVAVALGDIVIYTIRVYNEGQMDGYVEEITDHLPAQLEFIPDHEINVQYRWVQDENDPRTIRTDYLSQANEQNAGDNKLDAFNGTTLDYRDVQIACKVVQTDPMPSKITNIADITDFTDGDGSEVTDRDSQEDNVDLPSDEDLPGYKDDELDKDYVPGQQDDDDFEKLILKELDLSLRKFITGLNDEQITNRVPQVDVTNLANGTDTTAIYNHTKQPVAVALGDIVIYTIRVYNEGQVDGYVEEITDHLPAQLEFLPDHEINVQYRWVQDENDPRTVRTDYLARANEQTEGENKLDAFNGTTLDYRDVQIACRVVQTDPMPSKITNIADITNFTDGNGNRVPDRDSEEDNVQLPTDEDLPNYKDDEIDQDYVPGQQDDDDFEKLILKEFDLSLRKFITKVNDNVITNREPQVDITNLANGTDTTAIYNHTKEPVKVTIGSVVEYTIRVYNEGQVDGYVEEIKDHIPDQLEFLPDNETNQEYRWVMLDANGNVTQNVEEAVAIRTDYLSKANEQTAGENEIQAFDGQNLAYKDVKVAFRVIETDPMPEKITNIADISDFTDDDGNKVPDRDSEEDNVDVPSDEDLPNYKDDESDQDYVPGQQDDDDFEKVEIAEFDLSLRKFITAVNDSEITNRIPQVDVTPLIDGSGTTAIYNHPKDPVLVSNGNIVTYTIRVYNEGEVAGYASRIKDDIPEGLEFLPDNETNKEYRWVMLDEEGNVTENIEETIALETDYLSKEQEQEEGANLIAPFDGENLDYRDVKIAFRVIEPNTSDRILINKAQISEDTDEDGNDVKDRDSTPDEWNEGEDDQDIEKVKAQYFDLSLRKWVTQAIVNKNGEETVIDTGHKAEDDPEDIVAVDLKDSEIATTTVKFRYSIRVTNEGNIAGYAKEVKDYIPEGLIFVAEDNPLWTQLEDGTIITTQTENTLLEPGESTEVEVILTWDKEAQNFGVMDNWAEISKDDNDFDSPDIDSTPDNNVHGEDDIDDAPVMVTVKTGEAQVYIITTLSALGILGTGLTLIRKFVL